MSWLDEGLPTLRLLIGDCDDTPTYSDERLQQTLILSAKYVLMEIAFDIEYVVSMLNLTVTPDPLEQEDYDFINFCVLKAACISDQSTARAKALLEGIRVNLGPTSLAVGGHLSGFQKLLEMGPCKAYEDLKKQFLFSNNMPVRGILSPFVSNDFDPRSLVAYIRGHNGRNLY